MYGKREQRHNYDTCHRRRKNYPQGNTRTNPLGHKRGWGTREVRQTQLVNALVKALVIRLLVVAPLHVILQQCPRSRAHERLWESHGGEGEQSKQSNSHHQKELSRQTPSRLES